MVLSLFPPPPDSQSHFISKHSQFIRPAFPALARGILHKLHPEEARGNGKPHETSKMGQFLVSEQRKKQKALLQAKEAPQEKAWLSIRALAGHLVASLPLGGQRAPPPRQALPVLPGIKPKVKCRQWPTRRTTPSNHECRHRRAQVEPLIF